MSGHHTPAESASLSGVRIRSGPVYGINRNGCTKTLGIRTLRVRISWKVACGLALDDEGFDYSVLTYWRTRLRKSTRPERIFDAVRAVIDATGVLKGKVKRALDSTLLDDAVATQDTITQLVSAIRRVRRVVPGA